jgi:small-conductance mechanosensitive channel
MAENKSLETEVALIKHDVNQIGSLFVKLETALEKIGDVSQNIGQMLAVHESRLNYADEKQEEVLIALERAKKETDNDIKELHSRMTTTTRELKQEMSKDIDKVLDSIKDLKAHVVNKTERLENRISALERWRYILLGAITLAAFVVPAIISFLKI